MAGKSSVLQDDSLLSRLDRKLYRFESWLALLSGLAVFSLMVLAVVPMSQQPIPACRKSTRNR